MSERIMTLFGEEIVPEQPKPVGKSRAKKKANEELTDDVQDTADVPVNADEVTVIDEGPMFQFPPIEEVTEEVVTNVDNTTAPDATAARNTVDTSDGTVTPDAAVVDAPPATEPVAGPVKKQRAKPNEENIILPEDWHGDKQYYSIGEVAELFKVKTSHIRFWTNEFKLKVRTTRKGDRLYTPEQIRELRAIHHLVKERGFTLTGAKGKLKEQNNRDVHTVDLKASLQQLRTKLVIIKNQLA